MQLNVAVLPAHIDDGTVQGPGLGFTVTPRVALHPVESVYETIVVPAETPANSPVADPVVATAGFAVLHTPPVVPSVSADTCPAQSTVTPVIAAGAAVTEIVFVT